VNYRNHVQFHLTADGQLGYYAGRTKDVFPLQECHLPEVVINEVWPRLELDFIPGLEEVALRTGSDEDLQVILTNSTTEVPRFEVEDLTVSAVHISPGGTLVLAGSDRVYFEILGREFQVTAGAFFQVNTDSAARMVTHILETLPRFYPLSDSTTLMDVYCGVGLFSAFLAPHVGRLIGIESSPTACADFEVNLDEFDNVELYEATAEEVLPLLADHPEVILVDPPRSGIDRYAMDALIEMAPAVIVYVSCDPSTLARDGGKLLRGGYRLEQVTPFDLFPHTYHIESISLWVKA
jgi:23S rRNA (uracil1939-C5)-methyltransferase